MTYTELVRQNIFARKIVTVQILTYFGVWFSHVAIFSLLLSLDSNPFLVSLLAFCMFLPGIIQSPFTGVLADKLPLKKLMNGLLGVEITTTLLFMFITQRSELIWIFVLIAIRMSASSFYFTCKMSLLPRVLSSEELRVANELHSIVWSICYTAGMAISGMAVYYFGVKVSFFVDALLFCSAFAVFYTIQFDDVPLSRGENFREMFFDGIAYLKSNPNMFFLMLLHSAVALTAFDAIVALLAQYKYKLIIAVPLAIGFINAIRSVGLVLGGRYFGNIVSRARLGYFFVAQGVAIAIWGIFCGDFYLSLIGSFLTGLFTTTLWSYSMTMIQEECPEKYYGRVIAVNDMFFNLSAGATSLMIGFLASAKISPNWIFGIIGALFITVAVSYRVWYKKQSQL